MAKKYSQKPFHTIEKEVSERRSPLETPQSVSSAYQLAFNDTEFMIREELRPIRLQLELLKPEMVQSDQGIESTIVIFGSARIKPRDQAIKLLREATQLAHANPDDKQLAFQLRKAENLVELSEYYEQARLLAKLITEESQQSGSKTNIIVTGGGPGIMEAANRGADEANGESIGLNIILPHEQGPNPYITPELCFQFHYFAIRKMHFLIRARALIACPGGFGTMDELFEALTLIQTGKIDPIPIILMGEKFWNDVVNFDALVEKGMIDKKNIELFQFADTAEQAWDLINQFYE